MARCRSSALQPLVLLPFVVVVACTAPQPRAGLPPATSTGSATESSRGLPFGAPTNEQILLGRKLVLSRDCGACHGGMINPASDKWLAGAEEPDPFLPIKVWPRNLTPDDETGLGRVSERQIFNALRYGLRPAATPDVEITSMVPGEGNHPATPNYLAPAMPWVFWRYMADEDLWAIASYLKHGLKPVQNEVPPSEQPPDHWASQYTREMIGTHEFPPFPTEREELRAPERREQILRGRALVASTACSGCHGGAIHPGMDGWLTGMRDSTLEFTIGPFKTRPRNLTPDNLTGIGRFSERQIFNALRFGLRPGETPDVEITSTIPGQGNHPSNPKYLAPPMPWPSWRHLHDAELWAIAAYLKNGVKPVSNRVPDSEGPPDFWLSEYTVEKYGSYPPPPFPTSREREKQ